jgi:hypothetical protein
MTFPGRTVSDAVGSNRPPADIRCRRINEGRFQHLNGQCDASRADMNRQSCVPRQMHGKRGPGLIRSSFDCAMMGFGDFARDIQPESKAARVFVLLIRTSRQRVEDPLEGLPVDAH